MSTTIATAHAATPMRPWPPSGGGKRLSIDRYCGLPACLTPRRRFPPKSLDQPALRGAIDGTL